MYTVRLDRPARPVVDALGKSGIIARPLWRPMFELPAMNGAASWGDLPVTKICCADSISLPCSVDLDAGEQTRVIDSLVECLR